MVRPSRNDNLVTQVSVKMQFKKPEFWMQNNDIKCRGLEFNLDAPQTYISIQLPHLFPCRNKCMQRMPLNRCLHSLWIWRNWNHFRCCTSPIYCLIKCINLRWQNSNKPTKTDDDLYAVACRGMLWFPIAFEPHWKRYKIGVDKCTPSG